MKQAIRTSVGVMAIIIMMAMSIALADSELRDANKTVGRVESSGPALPYPKKPPRWAPNIAYWRGQTDKPDPGKLGFEEEPTQKQEYIKPFPRERIKVVDGVSFPHTALAPNGRIYCAGTGGGLLESADGGKTWLRLPNLPAASHDINGFGVLSDGTLLLSYGKRTGGKGTDSWYGGQYSRMDLFVVRSADGGKTWSEPVQLKLPKLPGFYGGWKGVGIGAGWTRFKELPDGTVLLPVQTFPMGTAEKPVPRDKRVGCEFLYRSTDGGKTWEDDPTLMGLGWSEVDLLPLPSGRILAAVRMRRRMFPDDPPLHFKIEPRPLHYGYNQEFIAHSDDDGKTWSPARMVTRAMETPGTLVRLSDGTVVLTYGIDLAPFGVRALVSKDQGKTWHPKMLVLAIGVAIGYGSGGHASSVVLPDDTIVTLYDGCKNTKANKGSVRAVRWRVPKELRVKPGVSTAVGKSSMAWPRPEVPSGKKLGSILNADNHATFLRVSSGSNTTAAEFKNVVLSLLDAKPGVLAIQAGTPDPVYFRSKVGTTADKYLVGVVKALYGEKSSVTKPQKNIADTMRRLLELGTDTLALAIEACREREVLIVASFRMNDRHFGHRHPELADFSRQHPEWMIPGRYVLDPAIPQVYEHRMAIFTEAANNYDIDGIELDFRRSGIMISDPLKNHVILTRMVRETRKMLDEVARKKGRKRLLLGVRVGPSIAGPRMGLKRHPDNSSCKDLGLDVVTWVKQGLVDYMCPSFDWGHNPGDDPKTAEFAALAKGTNVGIYPTVFPYSRWQNKDAETKRIDLDETEDLKRYRDDILNAVLKCYAEGADGISTFNWTPHSQPGRVPHPELLRADWGDGAKQVQMYIHSLLGDRAALQAYLKSNVVLRDANTTVGRLESSGPVLPYPNKPLRWPVNIRYWNRNKWPKVKPDPGKLGFEEDPLQEYAKPFPREHTKVVDGVSFPHTALAPNGRIYCAGTARGLIESADGGRTWKRLPNLPAASHDINGFGVLGDGTFLLSYGKRTGGKGTDWFYGGGYSAMELFVVRSTDGGKTWSEPVQLTLPKLPDFYGGWKGVCIGAGWTRFVELPDGTVLLPAQTFPMGTVEKPVLPDKRVSCEFLYRSTDGGKTWEDDPTLMGLGWAEVDLLPLPSGRILAAIRIQRKMFPDDPALHFKIDPRPLRYGYKQEFLAHSDDDGKTWSPARMVTRALETPGTLVRLSDGTVVLTYGMKLEPFGARALISKDEGRTWYPKILVLASGYGSGAHASSVVLPDDTIVTLYGCKDPKAKKGSIRAVRWRVPKELRVSKESR